MRRGYTFSLLFLLLLLSCIDPYEPKTITFEDILVVEALLTDEYKHQEVILSRSYEFEREAPYPETDALVRIINDFGTVYEFTEAEPGRYVSVTLFKAETNYEYTLSIIASNGTSYSSTPEQLNGTSTIDQLYASRVVDDFGDDGIAIQLDNSNISDTPSFFRYEYEETYKIIAPRWLSYDFALVSSNSVGSQTQVFATNGLESVILVPKEQEERICYGTNRSKNIIIGTTEELEENRLLGFKVRFVNSDDFILSHRYSILVKQYVTSFEAYTYYKTLKEISSSESLFSENQPGFFIGNIKSEKNRDEKIIGFFDVSAVAEERLFFNYSDFYPGERLPPYVNACRSIKPITLLEQVRLDIVHYNDPGAYEDEDDAQIAIPRECGDCTALGSNVKPSFWQD